MIFRLQQDSNTMGSLSRMNSESQMTSSQFPRRKSNDDDVTEKEADANKDKDESSAGATASTKTPARSKVRLSAFLPLVLKKRDTVIMFIM